MNAKSLHSNFRCASGSLISGTQFNDDVSVVAFECFFKTIQLNPLYVAFNWIVEVNLYLREVCNKSVTMCSVVKPSLIVCSLVKPISFRKLVKPSLTLTHFGCMAPEGRMYAILRSCVFKWVAAFLSVFSPLMSEGGLLSGLCRCATLPQQLAPCIIFSQFTLNRLYFVHSRIKVQFSSNFWTLNVWEGG